MTMSWKNPRDSQIPLEPLNKSYVHAACSEPLIGLTIGEILRESASNIPDHNGFFFPEFKTWHTLSEILEKSNAVAKSLLALGLKPGDTVIAGKHTDVTWLSIFFGAASIGLMYSKPYFFEPSHQYAEQVCKQIDCKAIILAEGDVAMMMKICPELASQPWDNLKLEKLPLLQHVIAVGEKKHSGIMTFEEFLKLGDTVSGERLEQSVSCVDIEDTGYILFTSGTTGMPKAVCQSHFAMINSSYFLQLRRMKNDVEKLITFTCNPIWDDFCCVLNSLFILSTWRFKITLGYIPSTCDDPSKIGTHMLQHIQDYRVTHCDVYPFYWMPLFETNMAQDYDLSHLKGGIIGSLTLPKPVVAKICDILPEFHNTYGMVEHLSLALGFSKDPNFERRLETTGFPFAHTEIKIIDDAGNIVNIREKGEICARGYGSFNGYYKDPVKTKEILDASGWIHTGDMGYMTEEGFISVLGRKVDAIRLKNMFGDIVYPIVVENAARLHPAIADASCVAVTPEAMPVVVLCIIKKAGKELSVEEIKEFCEDKLIDKDHPQHYLFFESFPMSKGVRKKVSKRLLAGLAKEML